MQTIKIKKNNKIICILSSRYVMGADNFQWVELALLVEVASKGFKDKNQLLKNLKKVQSRFYEINNSNDDSLILDLDEGYITIPFFPIYEFKDVNKENCCIELAKKDNHYYAIYEDEEVEMPEINYKNYNIFNKTKVTFSECKEINSFVNSLLETGYSDFVLNNERVIRLNLN